MHRPSYGSSRRCVEPSSGSRSSRGLLRSRRSSWVPNPNLKLSGDSADPRRARRRDQLYTNSGRVRSPPGIRSKRETRRGDTRATNTIQLFAVKSPLAPLVHSPMTRSRCAWECGGRRSPTCWCSRAMLAATSNGNSIRVSAKGQCCSPTPAGSTPRRRSIALVTGCSSLRPMSTRPAVRATRRSISRSSIRWRPTRRPRSPPYRRWANSRSPSTTDGSRWSSSGRSPSATSG